jgi:hypothetical protein
VRWLDDVVERDAASTGVGKDLEEAAADWTHWRNMLARLLSSLLLKVRCLWWFRHVRLEKTDSQETAALVPRTGWRQKEMREDQSEMVRCSGVGCSKYRGSQEAAADWTHGQNMHFWCFHSYSKWDVSDGKDMLSTWTRTDSQETAALSPGIGWRQKEMKKDQSEMVRCSGAGCSKYRGWQRPWAGCCGPNKMVKHACTVDVLGILKLSKSA